MSTDYSISEPQRKALELALSRADKRLHPGEAQQRTIDALRRKGMLRRPYMDETYPDGCLVVAFGGELAIEKSAEIAPPRRMYNTVRTDTLEHQIALYRHLRDYDGEAAIVSLARSIGAPVREIIIDKLTADYKRYDAMRGEQS